MKLNAAFNCLEVNICQVVQDSDMRMLNQEKVRILMCLGESRYHTSSKITDEACKCVDNLLVERRNLRKSPSF